MGRGFFFFFFVFSLGDCLTDAAYVLQPCGSVYVPEQQR